MSRHLRLAPAFQKGRDSRSVVLELSETPAVGRREPRRAAGRPAAEAGADARLDDLARDLSSPCVQCRLEAVKLLVEDGLPGGFPLLVSAARDADSGVRLAALAAITARADADVVPVLCEALADREYAVRLAASQALEERADERAVPALRAALHQCDRGGGKLSDRSKMVLWSTGLGLALAALVLRFTSDWKYAIVLQLPCQMTISLFSGWIREKRSRSPLALSLTRALSRVVEQHPGVGVRVALEPLRQIAGDRTGQDPATREESRRLAQRIEAATEAVKDLPVPAAATAPRPDDLPSPAAALPEGRARRADA